VKKVKQQKRKGLRVLKQVEVVNRTKAFGLLRGVRVLWGTPWSSKGGVRGFRGKGAWSP